MPQAPSVEHLEVKIAHLDQAFKKDAITAGAARYDDVGPLAPIDWNNGRMSTWEKDS